MNLATTLSLALGICASSLCPNACANTFPQKAVTLLVPFSAGGPTDVVARHLALAMGKFLGQSVVVENRPSAGGIVGTSAVVRAAPDGYTLLIHNIGMSTLSALSKNLPFDPLRDFDYIGQVADVPMTLAGRRTLPAANFSELQTYLKTQGERINLANAGIGTASHLCGLMLMSRLQIAMTAVPYKGAAPAMTDLQGGQVDLLCDQITTTLQPILTGRVKPYASTTRRRLPTLPDIPTLIEQGMDDFEVTVWHGIYAPKHLPVTVLSTLVSALQNAVEDETFRDSMQKLGALPVNQERASPDGLATQLRTEVNRWTPVIQAAQAYLD